MLALALGAAFWLRRLGVNDLDDAASNEVLFARQPLRTLVFDVPWPDQSPLYFLVLHYWSALGESSRAVGLLQVVLIAAAALLLHRVALRLCRPQGVADAAVVLAALSPASLFLVRNGRMYSLQLVLLLAAILFLLRFLDEQRPRDLVGFAIAVCLGVYIHFFGLVIAGALLVWLALVLLADARAPAAAGTASSTAAGRPATAVALVIVVLAVPQAARALAFAQAGGRQLNTRSVPGLSLRFLREVSTFWFVNSQVDTPPPRLAVLALYLALAYALVTLGTALATRRFRFLMLTAVLVPLLVLGTAAMWLDLRPRYFAYMLPLLWIAMANAGWGTSDQGGLGHPARALRAFLYVCLAACSTWALMRKLPERYAEWTKVMSGLQKLNRPALVLYMPPGPEMGTPRIVAEQLGLPPTLRRVRPLTLGTRPEFLREADAGSDFAFLVHWNRAGGELGWRTRALAERGYRPTVLPAWGAQARVYTREPPSFTREHELGSDASPGAIVRWARARLAERQGSSAPRDLAVGWVARVEASGLAHESVFFMSQHGEDGYWRVGEEDWNAVDEGMVRSAGVARRALLAPAIRGSTLVVAFPRRSTARGVRVSCGIADRDRQLASPRAVTVGVYIQDRKRADVLCEDAAGWRAAFIEGSEEVGDATLLITTDDERPRAVGISLESPWLPLRGDASRPADAAPVMLTAGRRLAEALPGLRAYRVSATGSEQLSGTLVTAAVSADDLHERPGPDGEGGLGSHFVMGTEPWNRVGITRQRSGGERRDGLWAHPQAGTVLAIAAADVTIGSGLEGYFGLTDYSLEQAAARREISPVSFTVFLDDVVLMRRDARREPGWQPFSVAVPAAGRHRLRIEITAARDSWAHFVFDVWSR